MVNQLDDSSMGPEDSQSTASTSVAGTMASTFKGRNTAKTADELKQAREARAADALKMKDEQLRILADQNSNLLSSLDKVEDEANAIQMEKIAIEQENRSLRDSNFELQSKTRAAETQSKRMLTEVNDKEKQLRIMTDQNSELLRLLESEETLSAKLQTEVSEMRAELDEIRQKHGALLTTAKTHEELATKAAKEGQLRAEEIRILRAETEQLKQQNAELKMKTQVEVEALQEQLRVRKEKQYQLLEKLQAQEEAKRQAEDQVTGMEDQLRGLHARNVDLENQLQLEARNKQNLEEANKELQVENNNLYIQNKDLGSKIEKSERERLRMEAEARDSGEQLREMAEKVFQLLERLKLAELGKTKSMEALKKKEQDMVSLQKKNARLIKESTEEGRLRAKAELDVKVLQDQVRTLKKQNVDLANKSKEEAKEKLRMQEEVEVMKEKLKTMESRLSFLLNKVQTDEESRVIALEDRKKLEAQVISFTEKNEELQQKLMETGESNRIITQAMRLKQEELNELQMKYDALSQEADLRESNGETMDGGGHTSNDGNESLQGATPGGPDDIDNVRLNEGRGRFYVEAKTVGGGSLLLLRGRKPLFREWLERHGINDFLKRAQKTTRFRDLVVERLSGCFGLLMVEEEEKMKLLKELESRDHQIDHLQKKMQYVQDSLAVEEDAKRRMLLRYIHAVKEHAMSVNDGTGGVLQLPESNISDEETHALAALLRNNSSIDEINLRGNKITDDGARALSAVLAGRSGLRLVDLRGNLIGKSAIRTIAEALERSERVRHVYVHAGGKVEALGAGRWAQPRVGDTTGAGVGDEDEAPDQKMAVTVETICVVDVRENQPPVAPLLDAAAIDPNSKTLSNTEKLAMTRQSIGNFSHNTMLDTVGAPKAEQLRTSKSDKNLTIKTGSKGGELSKSAPASEPDARSRPDSGPRSGPNGKAGVKSKKKAIMDRINSIKENSWQGRAAGMDRSIDLDTKESLRLRNKKPVGNLPPLNTINNSIGGNDSLNMSQHDPTMSNLNGNDEAGKVVAKAISKARKGGRGLKKPLDAVEKRLFNSPFAVSETKALQDKLDAKSGGNLSGNMNMNTAKK